MGLFRANEAGAARAIAALADCNPFVPERLEAIAAALGAAYLPFGPVWHAEGDAILADPNTANLREICEVLAAAARRRLVAREAASDDDLAIYRRLVFYLLWLRFEDDWYYLIPQEDSPASTDVRDCYRRFCGDATHFLAPVEESPDAIPHLFALGFQIRRAFDHIFRRIYGGSRPAGELRAALWSAIFTQVPSLYRDVLFDRLRDTPVLITGESGTGKDLVARAIALSQYVPFDPGAGSFAADPAASYLPVNLSALPVTLVEAEMFGHCRGAFTDARHDRPGCFESCGPHGAVFIDEIGDLDPAIQLKLLRVLQNREFRRLGEIEQRRFEGKLVAATHRDLERAIADGRFREDLYYRICGVTLTTPSLRVQLADRPEDLPNLILIALRKVVGNDHAPDLLEEVVERVHIAVGADYEWPGNMRELEQCVRGVIVRGTFKPRPKCPTMFDDLAEKMRTGQVTAAEVVRRFAAHIYATTRSKAETARVLGMNWRTIAKLLGGNGSGS